MDIHVSRNGLTFASTLTILEALNLSDMFTRYAWQPERTHIYLDFVGSFEPGGLQYQRDSTEIILWLSKSQKKNYDWTSGTFIQFYHFALLCTLIQCASCRSMCIKQLYSMYIQVYILQVTVIQDITVCCKKTKSDEILHKRHPCKNLGSVH